MFTIEEISRNDMSQKALFGPAKWVNGPLPCIFSDDRRYRYVLRREADNFNEEDTFVQFIGLNPSTADEVLDDPTVRRCLGFAKRWGYRYLVMTNLFAYRATDPVDMRSQDDPVGPDNMECLWNISREADLIVVSWGNGGLYWDQWQKVADLLKDRDVYCLGVTRKGQPKHPLYLRCDSALMQWEAEIE
jgi:hypothetical protein